MHEDEDDRVPVPTRLTETVDDGPHPADTVLLPLRPGAMLTIVTAGALPLPPHARVTVMWLLSTMLNPVTVTLLIVVAALKLKLVPVRFSS